MREAPKIDRRAQSKNRQRLGYRRIVQFLVYLVIIPTTLLLSLGVVQMFQWEHRFNLVLGILMVSVVAVIGLGVTLALVFLRREANLSELQADFVSKVSHDLRTPLTAIRLFTETLDRARGDEATTNRCIAALTSETDRLAARIDRLLDWGRMEAGRKLYELREESVDDVVREAVASFAPLPREDGRELRVQVDADLPPLWVDKGAVVDALVNLLSNAAKYGGSPPLVGLRAYQRDRWVVLEVTDNGSGIPRSERGRIFDKFYRIDDRLSRTREGSGLGLAIVKHVARAHRARIELESERDAGSTFRLLFPYDASAKFPRGTVSRSPSAEAL